MPVVHSIVTQVAWRRVTAVWWRVRVVKLNVKMIVAVHSLMLMDQQMIVMYAFTASFSTYTSNTHSIGLLHHGREDILEEKLGYDGRCL